MKPTHYVKLSILLIMFLSLLSVSFAALADRKYVEAFTFNNATGSNLNITGINGTVLTMGGTAQLVQGKLINGSGFDTAARLTSTNYLLQKIVDRSHTISFWVKPNATYAGATCGAANTGSIVGIGNNSIFTFLSICQTSFGYQWNEERAGRDYFRSNLSVGIDSANWHLLTVTYNYTSDTVKWYYDGTLQNTTVFDNRRGTGGSGITGLEIGKYNNALGFNGKVDVLVFYNYTMGQSEITEMYNGGAGIEPPFTSGASSNVTLTATDAYTSASLTNFTFCDQYGCNSTTTGILTLPYLANYTGLLTYTVNSSQNGGYFNKTFTNVNLSSGTLAASLSQSVITFSATEKISNATISGTDFTTSFLTNVTHYMRAQTYNVTASKSGYFSSTQEYTATALSVANPTIANMSNSRLNLTVRHAITGAIVNTYTASLYLAAYTHNESHSTTNGTILTNVISGTWNILVNASGYAYNNTDVALVSGTNNITVYVFTTESIMFNIYDEQTKQLINTTAVTIELIGSAAAYNVSTSNGTRYIDLITPDAYRVRYGATGYNSRFWYLTVGERSSQNVSLYLLNQSVGTNLTVTVLLQDGNKVSNALVKVLKYDLATISYIVREQSITDSQGKTVVDVSLNSEFYKFIVEYPINTVSLITEPAYLRETSMTLVIGGSESGSEFNYVLGAAGDLTFNYNTNNFRFDWSDTNNVVTRACVYTYRIESNLTGTYLNTSCADSTSGTILLSVQNITGAQYYAKAYFSINGNVYYVDSAYADFRSNNLFGALGILICIVLTVTIAMLFLNNPQALVLTLPIGVTITNLLNLTYFSFWIPTALWAAAFITWWFMRR